MFGFQRALGSLEAKRASQELKALYPKGQLNSEWIYDVIVSPKMPTLPTKGQKSLKFLIGILGEKMTL